METTNPGQLHMGAVKNVRKCNDEFHYMPAMATVLYDQAQ
jgi:hypothetical protein